MLGGHFLTPRTDPPTPWPADKSADLFTREVTEGMVVPRVERRSGAGLVATAATLRGMTAADESLFRGAARTALSTGLVRAGFGDPVLLSTGETGVAKGHSGSDRPYSYVLATFVPLLKARGLRDEDTRRILADNPRVLLSVR
ncbi:hypothetical protein [Streptomyces sp. NPDC051014]|uniref:phosphotriesterase family protein n=1 Tax=Streptomyces sp. NPDC051014 TaxID=3155751 RepID=UPI0033D20643